MTPSRRHKLNIARENLADVLAHLVDAERQWADLAPVGSAGGPGRSSGIADPTGEAGISDHPARVAERRLDDALERLLAASQIAAQVVTRWAQTLPARAEELQRLERQADPGCEMVARITRPDGSAYWEPEHRTTDLGGLLTREYRLGRWAYDFARRAGRLPTKAETQAHLEGRRVKVSA